MATLAEIKNKNQKALLKFIFEETGVQLPADTARKDLLDYVNREGLVDVEDNGDEDETGGEGPLAKQLGEKGFDPLEGATHVTLVVHEDDDVKQNYVQVSDEMGFNNQIKKGENVTVKIGVFHTLNDAVATKYVPETDKEGQLHMRPIKRHVHPFSIIQYHYGK